MTNNSLVNDIIEYKSINLTHKFKLSPKNFWVLQQLKSELNFTDSLEI